MALTPAVVMLKTILKGTILGALNTLIKLKTVVKSVKFSGPD